MKVDFYRHGLTAADASAVASVLDSPFLTTGSVSRQVETQLCDYFGTPHALLTSSWTNGALATLLAMGVGPGDEVIVPAMTFIASANIVELLGAKTVLVDVDPGTLLMTPEIAAAAVSSHTKAVIPVHLYGQMVDMAALRQNLDEAAAPNQKIYILEDCAHCFEGRFDGCRPGTYSDAASFSFYATKNVTCGEGGAVIFREAGLYERALETRMHGMTASAVDRFKGGRYNHWDMTRLGVKANLPDLLAALLPSQIETIDGRLPERQALSERYREQLSDTPIRLPGRSVNSLDACHLFAIGVAEGCRDRAIFLLNDAGISVTVNYRALPELRYYGDRYPEAAERCPAAMAWGRQTISLPLYPGLPREAQDFVISVLKEKIVPLMSKER